MKSTKSRPKSPKKAAQPAGLPELTERAWRIGAAAILAAGALLRFYDLGLKPLHHDEGVNGLFLMHVVHEGYYRYDPANYHGPTLYYLAALVARINGLFHGDGLSDASVRVITAIFGIATVALVLWLRPLLGKRGALAGAALIAVSPGAVFYSRYFIHETLFVFFALAAAVCGWLAWKRSNPAYLPAGAVAAAFLFATKETALASLVALALAVATQRVWARMRLGREAPAPRRGWPRAALYAPLGAALFAAVFVVLYSSFFTNFPKGIYDALASLSVWTKTGFTTEFYPKYIYLTWIWREEWPLALIGVAGTAVAVWSKPRSFAALAGIWGAGLFVAYTLIPYKEPWLALNFTIPTAIAGGYGAVHLWAGAKGRVRVAMSLAGAAALGVLLYQTVSLNFVHYADNDEPYVYLHTTLDINDLMRDIQATAARTGAGLKMPIDIVAPEYWPLPWYLREYKNTGYWGHMIVTHAPAVICLKIDAWGLKDRLGPAYQFVRFYDLRPGVTLALFTRK